MLLYQILEWKKNQKVIPKKKKKRFKVFTPANGELKILIS